jgi:excinuclease ABC subunit B
MAADPLIAYLSREQLEKLIAETERKMKAAAKDLDFIAAAQYRDELLALKEKWKLVL